jgi:hypothetical protein
MKIVMALATSDYSAPAIIREELRIRSILEMPLLTERMSNFKIA